MIDILCHDYLLHCRLTVPGNVRTLGVSEGYVEPFGRQNLDSDSKAYPVCQQSRTRATINSYARFETRDQPH